MALHGLHATVVRMVILVCFWTNDASVSTVSCRPEPMKAAASCRRGPTRVAVKVDLEVHRALERNYAEGPYLARQLSMFYHRQPATGVLGAVICSEGYRRMQNSMVNARDS